MAISCLPSSSIVIVVFIVLSSHFSGKPLWDYYKGAFAPHILLKVHSFILTNSIAPLQVHYYSEALPTTARILYRSFTPKRTGPRSLLYFAARAGVEPTTLRLKVIDSTNAPPRPTKVKVIYLSWRWLTVIFLNISIFIQASQIKLKINEII